MKKLVKHYSTPPHHLLTLPRVLSPPRPLQVLASQVGSASIKLGTIASPSTELIVIIILTRTNAANPLRNLRMVPPGGICAGAPFAAVADAGECGTAGLYRPFKDHSEAIVFNPHFLQALRIYRSIRFMVRPSAAWWPWVYWGKAGSGWFEGGSKKV